MNHSFYDHFFDRIPDSLLKEIGNGCTFGDKAYDQIRKSEPRLFESLYLYGLRSRIHDKAIQFYLQDRLNGNKAIHVACENVGFGNRVLFIYGKDFSIIPCHISAIDALPYPAKYKLEAAKSNPGNDISQLNFFSPPAAKDYLNISFILTVYFNGLNAIPKLVLPDNCFAEILDAKPVLSILPSDQENAYQERLMPKLIREVEKENEEGNK